MTRVLRHCVPVEMALLGLLELTLSFLLIRAMLTAPGMASLLAAEAPELARDCTVFAALLALTIAGSAATIGLYQSSVFLDRSRLITNATVAGFLAFPGVLLIGGSFNLTLGIQELGWFARILLVWLAGVLVIRVCIGSVMRHGMLARRVVILGSRERAETIGRLLRARGGHLFEAVAIDARLSDFQTHLPPGRRVWSVVVLNEHSADIGPDAQHAAIPQARIFDEAGFHERYLGRIDLKALSATNPFQTGRAPDNLLAVAVKRVFDIAVSVTLLFLTLPLMAVTALLISLDSPGPILYRQRRTGTGGKPFTLMKFRSMTVDAEAGGKPRWAQRHDPRVTRVGSVIRMSRIDELPQLINVLRGDMSMIGPRPERPHFVEELARVIPFFLERNQVKPGITGWAQVNYPYGASVEDAREKLAYDLYYVKNRSVLLDLMILAATVRVILFREGAR